MIDPRDLLIWVHTCPQRSDELDVLRQSLRASDVGGRFEVHRCRETRLEDIEAWRREKLLEHGRRAPWQVCLEDDVIVNAHFLRNVCRWPATIDPMFGVGILMTFGNYLTDPQYACKRRLGYHGGSMFIDVPELAGAQGVLHHSETTATILGAQPPVTGSDMDLGLTRGARRIGRRVYLHTPSIVQTSSVSQTSALAHHSRQHGAIDFSPTYRRGTKPRDQAALAVVTHGRVAYWMRDSLGQDHEIEAPLGAHELPDVTFALREGAPMLVRCNTLRPVRSDLGD